MLKCRNLLRKDEKSLARAERWWNVRRQYSKAVEQHSTVLNGTLITATLVGVGLLGPVAHLSIKFNH